MPAPRPGRWQVVETDAGWHLRLIAANGEPIVWSETHPDEDAAWNALAVVTRSTSPIVFSGAGDSIAAYVQKVDERTKS